MGTPTPGGATLGSQSRLSSSNCFILRRDFLFRVNGDDEQEVQITFWMKEASLESHRATFPKKIPQSTDLVSDDDDATKRANLSPVGHCYRSQSQVGS